MGTPACEAFRLVFLSDGIREQICLIVYNKIWNLFFLKQPDHLSFPAAGSGRCIHDQDREIGLVQYLAAFSDTFDPKLPLIIDSGRINDHDRP